MSEGVIETTVVADAEIAGWLCRKVAWPGRRGAMDHVFCKDGRIVWIEFKDKNKTPEKLQEREMARWVAHGAEVYWVDSIAQGRRILGL